MNRKLTISTIQKIRRLYKGRKHKQALIDWLRRRPVLEIQLSAIGKNDLCPGISGSYICDWLAISCRTQNDCDFIARLDRASGPACPAQDARTVCFDAPMNEVAVLVFHVQVNLRVGIGPDELRHGSFNGNSRLLVVCGVSM